MSLRVGFANDGKQLARSLPSELEGVPQNTRHATASEDGDIGRDFLGKTAMRTAALAGIFTFRVFPDDDPVQVGGRAVTQGRPESWQEPRGTEIHVLIEALADGQAQTPGRDMVGNIRCADGTEVDGVKRGQAGKSVAGHHYPMAPVEVRAPGKFLESKAEVSG